MDNEANLMTFARDLGADAPYASFDYCFNYFQSFHEEAARVGSPAVSDGRRPTRPSSILKVVVLPALFGRSRACAATVAG